MYIPGKDQGTIEGTASSSFYINVIKTSSSGAGPSSLCLKKAKVRYLKVRESGRQDHEFATSQSFLRTLLEHVLTSFHFTSRSPSFPVHFVFFLDLSQGYGNGYVTYVQGLADPGRTSEAHLRPADLELFLIRTPS
jgi:hypothetical protein